VYAVADGVRTWIFQDGVTHVVDHTPKRRAVGGGDAAALAAPMPATVTQVHVTPGQAVDTGDVLVTLEAMKMELSIRANVTGIVTAINCRLGELVQPGVPLVELREPEPELQREPGTEPEHERTLRQAQGRPEQRRGTRREN
jgi:3-methylcrotonyl-CoA carboxylase alpha subunit